VKYFILFGCNNLTTKNTEPCLISQNMFNPACRQARHKAHSASAE